MVCDKIQAMLDCVRPKVFTTRIIKRTFDTLSHTLVNKKLRQLISDLLGDPIYLIVDNNIHTILLSNIRNGYES
jgi:hypothetical protein